MPALHQVYKCLECGNIIEIIHNGGGELVCCGHPMMLMKANSTDAAQEKHVPVVEVGSQVKVTVGSVAHPMAEDHYIEWIEMLTESGSCKVWLKPGDAPEVSFELPKGEFSVRAYCNLHGLWKNN